MTETWAELPAEYGNYQVSDLGNVRSFRTAFDYGPENPMVLRKMRHARMKYTYVTLHTPTGPYPHATHRLVARAFLGERPVGHEVCHNNGKRGDSRLANLRYDTQQSNIDDRSLHGMTVRGENSPWAILTDEKVVVILDAIAADANMTELAEDYGVSRAVIQAIKFGRSWCHIPRPWGDSAPPKATLGKRRNKQTGTNNYTT